MKASINELPTNLKTNYDKWKAITGIDSLDSYFENALLELRGYYVYKTFNVETDNTYHIISSANYPWIFFAGNDFCTNFRPFEKLVNTTYENLKK